MKRSILLTTLNARYHHSAFGLRYLYANLKELQSQAHIVEYTINQNAKDIVESIMAFQPQIIGFGVYIWNTRQVFEVVSILKQISPETLIVLGGPEVSHETAKQPLCQLADYTICGEADFHFYQFCQDILTTQKRPERKWISGELPQITAIQSPYPYYTDRDIQERVIYVEASRGCPYKCEYCLSSLDKSVRSFDLDRFLQDMENLIVRGARQFKFVDRTFNLSPSTSSRILKFFLDRVHLGLFLHFEMVPDRLPAEIRELIQQFPSGSLQFEIGIQTWSPEVAKLVSRRQDYSKVKENFSFLTQNTGVHLHADLIVGLPGETLESFAVGFDAVHELGPHEIQVGILKRLKGTPIIRHDQEWQMIYQSESPFQILQNKTMSFQILQEMSRFSKFWDLVANSGNFRSTIALLRKTANTRPDSSFFWLFKELSDFLSQRHPQGNGIALLNLTESVWIFLTEELQLDLDLCREILIEDYTGRVKRDIPKFLRSKLPPEDCPETLSNLSATSCIPKRQQKHLAV